MSQKPAVDLSAFREITQNNLTIEIELFDDFCNLGDNILQKMQESIRSNDMTVWAANAHMLKGASLNLGAEDLAILCSDAQLSQELNTVLLEKISKEFEQVKQFLENQKNIN